MVYPPTKKEYNKIIIGGGYELMMMKNRLLKKKNYFLTLLAILAFYLFVTLLVWTKLPNEIYLPLRWDNLSPVGWYDKSLGNVSFVFLTPLLAILIIQLASAFEFSNQHDLFSHIFSKSLDLLGYLLALLSPLAFLICSFAHHAIFSYFFLLAGLLILVANAIFIRAKWQKEIVK